MPDRELLEAFPLFRKKGVVKSYDMGQIRKPTIKRHCPECTSEQTFTMINNYWDIVGQTSGMEVHKRPYRLVYRCVGCQDFEVYFIVMFVEDGAAAMKIGQFPPWDVSGDAAVEKLLGDHKQYLRQALISESQGYGIGAFAYYRRIVEEIIDELLSEIADLIADDERTHYLEVLEQAAKTRITAEKIELVKDLLPPILRPDGMNPLKTLHETLSEGLHAETDDRCLELSMEVRAILIFLATQVAITKGAAKSFTASMRTLLDKKAGRAAGALKAETK
jgi:hypothetical protein